MAKKRKKASKTKTVSSARKQEYRRRAAKAWRTRRKNAAAEK